jgi:hypothetical protein
MQQVKLKDCKPGEFIKRKPDAKGVYVKTDYDRSSKKYGLQDTEDMNRWVYLKGETLVYIGFEY